MSGNDQPKNKKKNQQDGVALTAEKEQKKPDETTRKTGGHSPSK